MPKGGLGFNLPHRLSFESRAMIIIDLMELKANLLQRIIQLILVVTQQKKSSTVPIFYIILYFYDVQVCSSLEK